MTQVQFVHYAQEATDSKGVLVASTQYFSPALSFVSFLKSYVERVVLRDGLEFSFTSLNGNWREVHEREVTPGMCAMKSFRFVGSSITFKVDNRFVGFTVVAGVTRVESVV